MNGEILYELYADKNGELCNCVVECWGNLEPSDQAVWNAMAEAIVEGYSS
jgi:hypothetical protein